MKIKCILLSALVWGATQLQAQTPELPLPHPVSNPEVLDLKGNPATLPNWGEKNLLIFYVDPDRHRQNHDFTVDMEENQRVVGENLYGLGVMNLKDAPMIPNGLARMLAAKRTEKNGATILSDQGNILRDQWHLGDCNNKFVLLIVSKEGELVYMHKGVFEQEAIDEFYRVVQAYR